MIFKLDSSKQEAALETARRKIAEVDASLISAQADVLKTEGQLQEAKSSVQQAKDELDVKSELQRRNPGIVPQRDIEKLQVMVDGRQGSLDAASASKQSAELRVSTLLPAEKASAEAALAQAQVDYDKTFVRAGVAGRVEQFFLRVGDIVNPLLRPAGILIPEGAGQRSLQAGFGQIEAQVMKVGMVAEATCVSKPWTIIPMVVTGVQDYIAAGQFRGGEQLLEAQSAARPGTILVFLEPLYKGGLEGVTAGSSCIVNAYTSNHELISSGKLSTAQSFGLHAIDAVGLVHALAVADPGAAAADQDAGVERSLMSPPHGGHMNSGQDVAMASDASCCRRRRSVHGNGPVRLSLVCAPDDADHCGRIARRRGGPHRIGDREPVYGHQRIRAAEDQSRHRARLKPRTRFRLIRPTLRWCAATSVTCRRRRRSSSWRGAVALLIAPPGSAITDLRELKRSTVGVVAGETNRKLTSVLTEEYDLGRLGVKFRDLAPSDARRALDSKEVRALLVVIPLTEKYLALVRGLFQQTAKTSPVLDPDRFRRRHCREGARL